MDYERFITILIDYLVMLQNVFDTDCRSLKVL